MVRKIDIVEADEYLMKINMVIGSWSQITDTLKSPEFKWINHSAPKEAKALTIFSQFVAGWLPRGRWKIFQIDNSTCLDNVDKNLINRLFFGADGINIFDPKGSFLFEFGKGEKEDSETEILISHLIFLFLLFDAHGYLVSSESKNGERVGIQDGFIYFSGIDKSLQNAKEMLMNFEKRPLSSPPWINEINGLEGI